MSKLTKVVQSKEIKKNFFKFNTLLKKRVSTMTIKNKNLNKVIDLNMGLFSKDKSWIFSFSIPGLWNWIVVDKKKYKKNVIKSQYDALNLNVSCSFLINTKPAMINNNKFKLSIKFPMINEMGKA